MKNVIVLAFLFASFHAFAQQPPGTEIYLFDLSLKKNKISISNPKNITNRSGYDNQPHFHPDKPLLYYASADDDGKTDILIYNYQTGGTQRLTTTTDREYSPTVTPDKKYISCIIQHENGTQDLGKYPIDGGLPQIIINNLTVGYHAWVDSDNVVLFVLGEPNTLRWYSVSENKDWIIAEKIGRSLHKIPGSGSISFVNKSLPDWIIKSVTNKNGITEMITQALHEREDLAWTPDRRILMSDGEQIMFWAPENPDWKKVELEQLISLKGITRIAVNSKGNKLAVVVSE